MTPERLQQIENLYHSALGREPGERASYLDEACAGDQDLRHEVGSLLGNAEHTDGFLEGRALEAAARSYVSTVVRDLSGKKLGRYEVIARLGEGGMGEVYRARDTRLKREVALKVLPPESMADPQRRRRFEREARAASALNHPNIITIHDIDRAEGIDFIAMEYVPGKTLGESIGRKGLTVNDAVKYAVQIADALAAAHSAGIVHRDLKPANIMINDARQVKVLDFGLAKLTERAAEEGGSTRTETGTIAGTVAYMSPEQATGKEIDARSDIFSFGAVLYEMLTGHGAFQRGSTASTLAAILKEEPKPPAELVPDLPQELERILRRCLRKEPERRFQHMADVKVALEELQRESDSVAQAGASRRRRTIVWAGALLAVAALAVAVWFSTRQQPQSPLVAVPFTTYPGVQCCPSFSPDGNQVAFAWNGPKQDNLDIYVKLIGAEKPLRLTTDPATDVSPAWSPDGRSIAFLHELAPYRFGVLLMPAIGGPARKLAEIRLVDVVPPAWSADGKWLAFTDWDSGKQGDNTSSIYAVSIDTGERRRLTYAPPGGWDWTGAFSPDGRNLIFSRGAHTNVAELYLVALSGGLTPRGEARQLTSQGRLALSPAWTLGGHEIVYRSASVFGAEMWRISVSGSPAPRRLEFAGDQVGNLAISHQGNRLIYGRTNVDYNIWRLELLGPNGKAGRPVNLISSTMEDLGPQYSPDGNRIVFGSNRSGYPELWVCDSDGSNPVQLTFWQARLKVVGGSPHWSPDGKRIVFDSDVGGKFNVYVIDAGGGRARCLTNHNHPGDGACASFSRDGRWIYFASSRTGRYEMWKMPAAGGEPVQLTRGGGQIGLESPDGKYLYYAPTCSETSLWRLPLGGGEEEKILEPVEGASLAVTSRGVYFIRRSQTGDHRTIERLDFSTGETTIIATLPRPTFWNLSVSPDERYLLYSQLDQSGNNLMLVENFR